MILNGTRLGGAIILGLGLSGAALSAQIDKLAVYAQMRTIAAEQQSLRNNPAMSARAIALQSQFDALQASMGGDDPTRMYEETGAARSLAVAKVAHAAPAAPPGTTMTTMSVTNNTPTVINDVAVVTSTITVTGADPYLWDVDVTTFLQHTFPADLDISITSPAGTVVTLTTDNGASNDNVFNGTVWDDQANPGGQVPYASNNGIVTDQVYSNLVTASPLVAEEALGAFRGENPNGIWTITISDDLAGDTGTLSSWTLDLASLATAPTETTTAFSNNTATAIGDNTTTTSTLTVSGAGTTLTNVNLTTALQHTYAGDLDVTLTSPAGTVVTLTTDNGNGNDNIFDGTVWNDYANLGGALPYSTNNGLATDHAYSSLVTATPLVAEEALSAFIGENPNGIWTITLSDDLAGDTGALNSWSLNITTGTGITPKVPVPTTNRIGLMLLALAMLGLAYWSRR